MGTRTFLTRQAMKTISFYARATHLKKKKKKETLLSLQDFFFQN